MGRENRTRGWDEEVVAGTDAGASVRRYKGVKGGTVGRWVVLGPRGSSPSLKAVTTGPRCVGPERVPREICAQR